MLKATVKAIHAILETDPTVVPRDRAQDLALIRQGPAAPKSESGPPARPQIVSRDKTAEMLDKSLRFVDRLDEEGILKKVYFPAGNGRRAFCCPTLKP